MKRLERTLDLWSVVAVSISAMLGSGVFVLPGLAMVKTGSGLWMAYIATGICVLPAALCTSELATAMPTSGGKYFFIDRTFGPLAGTIAGIGLWLSLLLKSSFALIGFGMYLAVVVALPVRPTALVLLILIVLLNVLGIKKVSKALKWVVAICTIGLVILIVAGITKMDASNLDHPFEKGAWSFFAGMAFIFVSFAGVTKVAAIAEEVKNPSRNLPLGILISLGIVVVIYGTVTCVLVGTVSANQLMGDKHPIYLMAKNIAGSNAGKAAAILAVLTMTSMANAGLLAASRFPFAMSRDNLLPPFLQVVHPRFMTPVACILFSGVVMAFVIVFMDVEKIAKLASAFLILMFISVNCAVMVLRESDIQWYRPAFRLPMYPWVPIFGIVTGSLLLIVMGWLALFAVAGIALPGASFYWLYGRRRTTRQSVMRRMRGTRKISEATEPPELDAATLDQQASETLKASVMVALVGQERSPETIVEIGAAISQGKPLNVVQITEIPEQMFLDSQHEKDLRVQSLERRLEALAQEKNVSINFDAVVTHDLVGSIHEASQSTGCNWILKEWRWGGEGGVFLRSPFTWALYALPCNLALFKDAGVRYIRRIMILAEPGPHDALVVNTADHLARTWGAELTFAGFVPDQAAEIVVQSRTDYIDELRHMCRAKTHHLLLRGTSELQALVKASAGFDLLVMGEPEEGFLRSRLLTTMKERLTEKAVCSVLRLKTPRVRTHEQFNEQRSAKVEVFDLMSYLDSRTITVQVVESKKERLLTHFGKVFASALAKDGDGDGDGISERAVTDALWERERMQNTAIGQGLALPHATLNELDRSLFGVFVTAAPLDYQARDKKPVQIFFVTLSPPSKRQVHLKLLSTLARLVRKADFVSQLKTATNADTVIEIFRKEYEESKKEEQRKADKLEEKSITGPDAPE